MVAAMHEAGIEVILDVVYNHTAEGNHLGPTLCFKGIDNAAYYRLVEDDLRYYMDYTGTGNSLNVRHPHSLQLIMDSLRYWVTEMHVDGFRFDLAADAGPRVLRRRPALDLLRARAAGPGRQPGQADRRAVGRRPRRLPGRQLPAAVDGVERQVPRHRPRLLARRAGARRVREPAHGLVRPLRALRPPPGREHQLRHRPRRLHAARPGLLQREAQRGQRRGQQRRREPQPLVELRRRGTDRRPRDPRARARASSATSSPRCCSARACRCCSTATSSAAPSTATTTPTARTPRSPGSTGTTSTSRWSSSPPRVSRLRRDHPTFRRRRFFTGTTVRTGAATASASTTSSGSTPTGHPMEDGDWTAPARQSIGDVPQRPRHPRRGRPRRARSSTTTSCSTSTPGDDVPADPAARGVRRGLGRRRSTPAGTEPTSRRRRPDRRSIAGRPQRRSCCVSTRGRRRARLVRGGLGRGVAGVPRRQGRMSRPTRGTTTAMRAPVSTYRLQITAGFDLFAAARTLPLPARPRRRLGLPLAAARGRARLRPRLRRRRARPGRPGARRRRGAGRAVAPRPAGSGWACSSTSCPTTSASPRRTLNAWWWDVLQRGRASRLRRRRSTSTGTSATAGSGSRCSATTTATADRRTCGSTDDELALLRPPLPDRARAPPTTATTPRDGARPAALRAGQLAARRPRAQLPALLRGQHPGRHPGRGPGGLRRARTSRSGAGSTRARRRPAGRPPRRPARPERLPRRPRRR